MERVRATIDGLMQQIGGRDGRIERDGTHRSVISVQLAAVNVGAAF